VSKKNLQTLRLLKQELEFLERGAYGGALSWKPVMTFLQSPSCPNRLDADHKTPCPQCWLYSFVPEQFRQQDPPCHHIPLTADGESVHTLSQKYTAGEVGDALRDWLKNEIRRLELPDNDPGRVVH